MATVSVLNAIKDFIADKVSPGIRLQMSNDNNVDEYQLLNPNVFVGWIPPKGYLPEGMESAIPCLIVGLDSGAEDTEDGQYDIRIPVAVYSPGLHASDESGEVDYTPDLQGYIDLLNIIDRTVAALSKNLIITDAGTIQKPIKWGMYDEQPYPYWYGWITFTLVTRGYPESEIARKFL